FESRIAHRRGPGSLPGFRVPLSAPCCVHQELDCAATPAHGRAREFLHDPTRRRRAVGRPATRGQQARCTVWWFCKPQLVHRLDERYEVGVRRYDNSLVELTEGRRE